MSLFEGTWCLCPLYLFSLGADGAVVVVVVFQKKILSHDPPCKVFKCVFTRGCNVVVYGQI